MDADAINELILILKGLGYNDALEDDGVALRKAFELPEPAESPAEQEQAEPPAAEAEAN